MINLVLKAMRVVLKSLIDEDSSTCRLYEEKRKLYLSFNSNLMPSSKLKKKTKSIQFRKKFRLYIWSTYFQRNHLEEHQEFDHMNYTRRDQEALTGRLITTWCCYLEPRKLYEREINQCKQTSDGWWLLILISKTVSCIVFKIYPQTWPHNIFDQFHRKNRKTIVILSFTAQITETNFLWTKHGHFPAGVAKISSLLPKLLTWQGKPFVTSSGFETVLNKNISHQEHVSRAQWWWANISNRCFVWVNRRNYML